MKERRSIILTILMMVMLIAFSTTTVQAEELKKVDKITIETNNYVSTRVEKPWIYIYSDGCYAEGDINWDKDFKYIKSGEAAHGVVNLRTNYGYRFDIDTQVKSNNDNTSATLEIISNEEARLNVRYEAQKKLGYVEFKQYNCGDRYLKWKKVSGANEYELSFFRSCDSEFYETFTTTKTEFDLNKIKKELSKDDKIEDLYCEIRALSDEDYLLESEITTSTILTLKFNDNDTSNSNSNNSSIKNTCQWVERGNENWYYTDKYSNKNATGWQLVNGKWYYLNPNDNGKMCTGWILLKNIWYYLDSSGAMASNTWKYINGNWYYFYADGAMVSNCWQYINGNWYFFYTSGDMAYDRWIGNYYVNHDGAWVR